ncbi:MAG: alpha-hydroxy-acid oxidizing protein [Actinobacteria bacterium]|nr:alpha-hydroxy-acid oxidizing protein [Actinomycetota bacterium]
MALRLTQSEFEILRDNDKCISCQVCVRQCANDVHSYDEEEDTVYSEDSSCVGCHRCESLCPTGALKVKRKDPEFKENFNWTQSYLRNIYKQADSGGVILTGMGCDRPYRIYWDHILFNAAQVTNPSIDPLREPMEIKTFIGRKPDKLEIESSAWRNRITSKASYAENNAEIKAGEVDNKIYDNLAHGLELKTKIPPQLELSTPIMFSAMSYGSISLNACKSLAAAASQFGTFYNTGEGGLHKDLYRYAKNTIVQVASGRFGVDKDYLSNAAAIEIKIGQGAKPGIGGHLPGEKVSSEISSTRMIPIGTDALSPAPHHDIYSIEDLAQLIYALKEATEWEKPVGVKISAVHNVAPIASGIVRAGADFVTIDGFRGGTGAAPLVIRDNVGIPIELALASVDTRLREEGIRHKASIIVAGSIRSSSDIIKAIALGADAVYIGTAALVAMGCHLCQKCYTGKCNWGIATQDPYLTKRLNPEIGTRRLLNLLRAWSLEIKEMLGGAGINAIESLRGNREHLRGVNLTERELSILGIKHAGEAW